MVIVSAHVLIAIPFPVLASLHVLADTISIFLGCLPSGHLRERDPFPDPSLISIMVVSSFLPVISFSKAGPGRWDL